MTIADIRPLIEETAAAARKRTKETPKVGVVLGSGLGAFADTLDELVKVPYAELPHLPASKVVGHAGNLCFGRVRGVPVVCMQGRVHLYEGHSVAHVVHGARTMARLGVTTVLITNAAGGVEASWSAGDLMLMTDHLNLTGHNPLMGPNDDTLGPRFPDMTRAYDPQVADALRDVAKAAGIPLRQGVYAGLLGPTYETPAEVRMMRTLGAQAVGMSTVLETIALRHMGVKVGGLSCITNLAAGITEATLNHAEVEDTAKKKGPSPSNEARDEAAQIVAALVSAAKDARKRAYAPYSKYKVGAAVLTESGDVFIGCNVENASYGATMCAERNAIAQMISAGGKKPVACAVVTQGQVGGSPCGICRQVLAEFSEDMTVILAGEAGGPEHMRITSLSDLLPDAFTSTSLKKSR